MDISKATEKRKDIVAVVKQARELGGWISAQSICTDLINRPSAIPAGELILLRCKELGLFDPNNNLTEDGVLAAESETVFIPEQGTYRIWLTEDPLVPQRFLSYKPIGDGSLRQDVWTNGKDRKDKNTKGMVPVPPWFKDHYDLDNLVYGTDETVKIKTIAGNCRKVQRHGLSVSVHLKVNRFQPLQLSLKSTKWDREESLEAPDLSFEAIWEQLLGYQAENWDGSFLLVGYDELDELEMNSFKKDVHFESPQFLGLGKFDSAVVRGVPIAPESEDDASMWASHLLKEAITGYLTREEFEALQRKIVERPEFLNYYSFDDLALPEQQDLADELKEDADRLPNGYWFLQAPLDLGPLEVEHDYY